MKKIDCLLQNCTFVPNYIYCKKYALPNNNPNRTDYDYQVNVCDLRAQSKKWAPILQQAGH